MESPTGERQSSPVVWSKYPRKIHPSATMPRSSAPWAPYQKAPKPSPNCNSPRENLSGVLGSRSIRPRKVHKALNAIPNRRM